MDWREKLMNTPLKLEDFEEGMLIKVKRSPTDIFFGFFKKKEIQGDTTLIWARWHEEGLDTPLDSRDKHLPFVEGTYYRVKR